MNPDNVQQDGMLPTTDPDLVILMSRITAQRDAHIRLREDRLLHERLGNLKTILWEQVTGVYYI